MIVIGKAERTFSLPFHRYATLSVRHANFSTIDTLDPQLVPPHLGQCRYSTCVRSQMEGCQRIYRSPDRQRVTSQKGVSDEALCVLCLCHQALLARRRWPRVGRLRWSSPSDGRQVSPDSRTQKFGVDLLFCHRAHHKNGICRE